MRKNAFTLVELLIVILIVAVLLALLLPAMRGAKEGARRALCMNNLRQHGIAWYLYLDEHNGNFPTIVTDPGEASETKCGYLNFGGKKDQWGNAPARNRPLNPYLGIYTDTDDINVFRCPGDIISPSNYYASGNSYMLNYNIRFNPPSYDEVFPLSNIMVPHDRMYLERCNFTNLPGHNYNRGTKYNSNLKYVMVLFVDGHVGGPYSVNNDFEYDYDYENNIKRKVLTFPYEHPYW